MPNPIRRDPERPHPNALDLLAAREGIRQIQPHTIHLLDDDSDSLLFLFEYLSGVGFNVVASPCAADALSLIARSHPAILIADKDMPEMTATEVLDSVRTLSPGTRVILTTERLDRRLGNQLLRLDDVDLVIKPFNWAVLLRAVERALGIGAEQGRASSPRAASGRRG